MPSTRGPCGSLHAGVPDRNPSTLSFLSTTIALTGNFSSRTIYSRAAADAIKSAVVQRVTANGTVALPVGRVFLARLTAKLSQGTTGRRLEVRGNAPTDDPEGGGVVGECGQTSACRAHMGASA
jgi:hypothetical protein